ncbi:hypothetical protein [Arsenicicoccus sp. UBA7492]|uniref:hypothetical protein n=1 Tax=Arsenicicoccus sp. UBA7492 TaxID=1946057 RepID=UPI00257B6379|nr:hypothetical protein [Arsenicicoccus sp. UBA7492]
MGTSWKPLFAGRSLVDELDEHRLRLRAQVLGAAPAAVAQVFDPAWIQGHLFQQVHLVTDQAVLESEPVGGDVGVTVRIPLAGNPALLHHAPPRLTWIGEAQVRDGSGFYTGDPEEQPSVAFAHVFDPGISWHEVRTWAENLVNRLDRFLLASSAVIEEFNAQLLEELLQIAHRRLRAIERSAGIRGPLRTDA